MKHLMTLASALIFCVTMTGSAFGQDTAQQALDENDVSEAVKLLTSQTTSNDVETAIAGFCGEAQIAMQMGEVERAQDYLNKAEEKRPDLKKKSGWNAVILWLRADLARLQGNQTLYIGGLKDVKKAIDAGAKVEDGWEASINYFLSLETTDNSDARHFTEDAIEGFSKANMYDEEAAAHIRLAALEWQRDKKKYTIEELNSARKAYEHSKSSDAQLHIAEVQIQLIGHLVEMDKLKEAKKELAKAPQMLEAAGNPPELAEKWNEFNAKLGE